MVHERQAVEMFMAGQTTPEIARILGENETEIQRAIVRYANSQRADVCEECTQTEFPFATA